MVKMQELLDTDIKFLHGVGPRRAEILNKELKIFTFRDLLYYFPYRYIDRTKFYHIREINGDLPYIQVRGKITGYEMAGVKRGQKRLTAEFTDGTGILELIWFRGHKWIPETYPAGKEFIVFGKPSLFNHRINLVHPEIDDVSKAKDLSTRLQPAYITTEKMKNSFLTAKAIQKMVGSLLGQLNHQIEETLPAWLLQKVGLIPLWEALQNIHYPDSPEILKKAEFRLKFEELFFIQLNILRSRSARDLKYRGYVFTTVGEHFNTFYRECLPFELTGAQKKVLKEIRRDMGSGKQMNRLLQGDVGSGKTMVALMSMLIAMDNGFQSCFMAPTEILAIQHFNTLKIFLDGMPVTVELLTGSTRKSDRTRIHESLENGSLNILVGTHALIEDKVKFQNLGLVIVDEQHRFGVAQRARLWKKKPAGPPCAGNDCHSHPAHPGHDPLR